MARRYFKSICWNCRNAVTTTDSGCPWSDQGIPVPGWDAEHHRSLEHGEHIRDTYEVKSCPLFDPDGEPTPNDGTTNNFINLAYAVAAQCCVDYYEYYARMVDNAPFYEVCARRAEQYAKIREWIFGKRQRARRRGDDEAMAFLNDKLMKLRAIYKPYLAPARHGEEARKMVKDCEKFFLSESYEDYSDMDGARTMNLIRERVMTERRMING